MKRRALLQTAAISPFLMTASSASAFLSCGPDPDDNGPIYEGELLSGLEHTFWVPIGPQNRKATVYAVVAPWCPFCTRMTTDALAGKLDVNIRAIPSEPRNFSDKLKIYDLVTKGDSAAIKQFHDRRPATNTRVSDPQLFDVIIGIQQHTQWSVQEWTKAIAAPKNVGFPMVILKSSQGGADVQLSFGYSPGVARDLTKVAEPIAHSPRPVDLSVAEKIRDFRPGSFRVLPKFEHSTLRILPIAKAMPSECTKSGFSYGMKGTLTIDGADWYVTRVGNQGVVFASSTEFSVV